MLLEYLWRLGYRGQERVETRHHSEKPRTATITDDKDVPDKLYYYSLPVLS